MSSRREARAQRMAEEAHGVDARAGEAPLYACPPELLAPAVVEEWLTSAEIASLDAFDALLKTSGRWRDARDAYVLAIDDDTHTMRFRAGQLCGPTSRPVWARDAGKPWHTR